MADRLSKSLPSGAHTGPPHIHVTDAGSVSLNAVLDRMAGFLALLSPDGTIIDKRVDVSKNGIFETQLYFPDDPHNDADADRFSPNGFNPNRVMDIKDGKTQVNVQVGLEG
jgi:hypothetical protein